MTEMGFLAFHGFLRFSNFLQTLSVRVFVRHLSGPIKAKRNRVSRAFLVFPNTPPLYKRGGYWKKKKERLCVAEFF